MSLGSQEPAKFFQFINCSPCKKRQNQNTVSGLCYSLSVFALHHLKGTGLQETCSHCHSATLIKLNLESKGGVSNWLIGISHRYVRGLRKLNREGQKGIRRVLGRFHGLFNLGNMEESSSSTILWIYQVFKSQFPEFFLILEQLRHLIKTWDFSLINLIIVTLTASLSFIFSQPSGVCVHCFLSPTM